MLLVDCGGRGLEHLAQEVERRERPHAAEHADDTGHLDTFLGHRCHGSGSSQPFQVAGLSDSAFMFSRSSVLIGA